MCRGHTDEMKVVSVVQTLCYSSRLLSCFMVPAEELTSSPYMHSHVQSAVVKVWKSLPE